MSLQGKTALIIGGGTGIGLGCANALAGEACRVAIAGRRETVLGEATESWTGTPPILTHTVDVADRKSVQLLIDWAHGQLGQIDILVNSAGINIPNRTMAEMHPEQWDEVMTINATGAYSCMHAVLPRMKKQGDGLIINISSIGGKRAAALGGIAYNASKFAMTALSIAAGNELAKDGIRITNILPGEVDTPILDQRPEPVRAEHRAGMLQPDDIGQLVVCIACLPRRVHVPEIIVKPLGQEYF